jgi:hypothetical protein
MSCPTTDQAAPPASPRPRRKTAKAAAETISKALDTTDDSGEEEEYTPTSNSNPLSPKRPPKIGKRRSNSATCPNGGGKKCALSPETTEYLKNWMLSPDHINHPYPTEEEKACIMRHCGIEMKQLTNWFVNNRKRIWKPKLEEMKKRQNEDGVVVSMTEEEVRRSKKLCVKTSKSHGGGKALNRGKVKVAVPANSTALVNNPLDKRELISSPTNEALPPLPPPAPVATITPLVDPTVISTFSAEDISSAPLLPTVIGNISVEDASSYPLLPTAEGDVAVMPHSCNLVDPLTNKMNRYIQPCALCSACRDWNTGEFCPWDLTGLIGEITDDTMSADETLEVTMPKTETTGSIVSEDTMSPGGNDTTHALAHETLSDGIREVGIGSFPSTASFPVPQEIGQGDLISDMLNIDVNWD